MEYAFGNNKEYETLRTKGSEHTNLNGFVTVNQDNGVQSITDQFHVIEKYDSKEDVEGNCYDWYTIDQHMRMIDNMPKVQKEIDKVNAVMEYIAMMTDVEIPTDEEDSKNEQEV